MSKTKNKLNESVEKIFNPQAGSSMTVDQSLYLEAPLSVNTPVVHVAAVAAAAA